MRNLIAFVLFFIPILVSAQDRQPLYGKGIADETAIDFLSVKNTTTDVMGAVNDQASFSIAAKEGDVIEFSAPAFKTLTHTLTAADIKEELFVIRLEPSAILLDAVELSGLTGNLYIDSKHTDVILLNERFKDDFDAAALNLGRVNTNPGGNLDFIAILGAAASMAYSALSPEPTKKNPGQRANGYRPASVEQKSFSKVLLESYPESFFTDIVKIPREKLALFLISCNESAKRYLLDPKNEAELIIYLKERYTRFANQTQ